MQGQETEMSKIARKFALKLHSRTSLEVVLVDERLTSVTADQLLDESAVRGKQTRKRNRTARDQLAAELILRTHFGDN